MTVESRASQVRALETQLAVLKAQLAQISPSRPSKTFGDPYGALEGTAGVSEEEIEAAKYRFAWEGKVEG
jgi:hypothetical protein